VEVDVLKSIMFEIRENQMPYFEEDEIEYYYEKNGKDKNNTIYELLLLKSEDSTISVSGLNTQDTSSYFKRIASRFRPTNSGILEGG
jgi:hypothetical protein